MFDRIEALIALADKGTMRRAALALHISQSAISKRIQSFEHELKHKLIEPEGRRVILTPFAVQFLKKARPLLYELKSIALDEGAVDEEKITIDVSVSVLISWGAAALAHAQREVKGLGLAIGAHHASVAVERVRSGESKLALVQGKSTIAPDLTAQHVFDQEFVIIPSGLKPLKFPRSGALSVMTIESHTEAAAFIQNGLMEGESKWGVKIVPTEKIQSFSAIVQLARAGFGHGLAPLDVARTLGIPAGKLVRFPKPGLSVPISLIGRRSTLSRPIVQKLFNSLVKRAATL